MLGSAFSSLSSKCIISSDANSSRNLVQQPEHFDIYNKQNSSFNKPFSFTTNYP